MPEMPMLDHNEFDPSMVPAGYKKDTRDLIAYAVLLGWKVHITTSNSITIISPGERKKYHFGLNGRSTVNHNRIRRDIVKFADPERLMLANIAGEADDEIGRAATDLLIAKTASSPQFDVEDHRPELEEGKREREERRKARTEAKKARSHSERHVVSEKPMTAKGSEGRAYDSRAITERLWSDGKTDYKCNDCDYSSENRLSVRGHISSHRKGVTGRPSMYAGDVPKAAHYKPRKDRVEALAAVLAGLLETNEYDVIDPQEVALQALTWVHEQARKGTALAEEREPMTPEETLERIKSLVDSSGYSLAQRQRMAEMEERLLEQEQRLSEMNNRVEQAEQYAIEQSDRAERSEATLEALRELVTEATVNEAERKAG